MAIADEEEDSVERDCRQSLSAVLSLGKRGGRAPGKGCRKPQAARGGGQGSTPELAWLAARSTPWQKSENLTGFFIVSPAPKCVNSAPIQGATLSRRGRQFPLSSTAYRARHADTTDTAGIGFLLYRLGSGIRENSRHCHLQTTEWAPGLIIIPLSWAVVEGGIGCGILSSSVRVCDGASSLSSLKFRSLGVVTARP